MDAGEGISDYECRLLIYVWINNTKRAVWEQIIFPNSPFAVLILLPTLPHNSISP